MLKSCERAFHDGQQGWEYGNVRHIISTTVDDFKSSSLDSFDLVSLSS